MAGKTVAGNSTVIKSGYMPAYCGMTIVALIITIDVTHRLASGIGIVVTAVTQHRSACELSFVVALIARHVAMLAGKWKSGGEMVVIGGDS
jgi:hypothetical protein